MHSIESVELNQIREKNHNAISPTNLHAFKRYYRM